MATGTAREGNTGRQWQGSEDDTKGGRSGNCNRQSQTAREVHRKMTARAPGGKAEVVTRMVWKLGRKMMTKAGNNDKRGEGSSGNQDGSGDRQRRRSEVGNWGSGG